MGAGPKAFPGGVVSGSGPDPPDESESDTSTTPPKLRNVQSPTRSLSETGSYLVRTAIILTSVKLSTRNKRPMANVKNPRMKSEGHYIGRSEANLPLMLDKMVALATLVYSRAALRAQFAINHKKQNHAANFAVSRIVSGGCVSSCGIGSGN